MSWFPLPSVQNCIASGYEIVNATDFIVRIDYDPAVSLRTGVYDDYNCNLTFSTDIFQCQLMTNFSFNFSATILVTGTPQTVGPLMRMLSGLITTVTTLFTGGSALLRQSRASSLSDLSSCQFSLVDKMSPADSPTQYGFGNRLQFYHRGCVVGNLSLVGAFAVVVLAVVLMSAMCWRQDVAVMELLVDSNHQNKDLAVLATTMNTESSDDAYIEMMSVVLGDNNNNSNSKNEEEVKKPPPRPVRREQRGKESYSQAVQRVCGMLGFPSIGAMVFFLLGDSVVLSSVSLLVHPQDEEDVPLGYLGLGINGAVLIVLTIVTTGFIHRTSKPNRLPKSHPMASAFARRIRWLCVPRVEYIPARRRDRHFLGMLHFLIDESKYAYFVCCDFALTIVMNALLGIGISERSLCLKLAYICFGCYFVFYVFVLYLRPSLNRLSMVVTIVNNTLAIISSALVLASMATGVTVLGRAVQAIAVAMQVVSVIESASMGVGVFMFVCEVKRLLKTLRHSSRLFARDEHGNEIESCSDDEAKDDVEEEELEDMDEFLDQNKKDTVAIQSPSSSAQLYIVADDKVSDLGSLDDGSDHDDGDETELQTMLHEEVSTACHTEDAAAFDMSEREIDDMLKTFMSKSTSLCDATVSKEENDLFRDLEKRGGGQKRGGTLQDYILGHSSSLVFPYPLTSEEA